MQQFFASCAHRIYAHTTLALAKVRVLAREQLKGGSRLSACHTFTSKHHSIHRTHIWLSTGLCRKGGAGFNKGEGVIKRVERTLKLHVFFVHAVEVCVGALS